MLDELKKHGNISWGELMCQDTQAAKTFYSNILGWEYDEWAPPTNQPGDEPYHMFRNRGEEPMTGNIGGIMKTPSMLPPNMPAMWTLYFSVDDVDAVAAKTAELGGKILVAPYDMPPVGRFAVLQDPQGAIFQIIKYMS